MIPALTLTLTDLCQTLGADRAHSVLNALSGQDVILAGDFGTFGPLHGILSVGQMHTQFDGRRGFTLNVSDGDNFSAMGAWWLDLDTMAPELGLEGLSLTLAA